MTLRVLLAVMLLGTATAHAQIGGAGGASPAPPKKADQRLPVGSTHVEPPALLKAPATKRPSAKPAKPSQPPPSQPPARAALKGR